MEPNLLAPAAADVRGRDRYVTLDGMRGLAALTVAIHHFGYPVIHSAYIAVDFFFLLSGFVLTRVYGERLNRDIDGLAFARIRVIRLWPIHLVGVVLGSGFAFVAIVRRWQGAMDVQAFWISTISNLLFLPSPASLALFPTNMPAWSLFYELVASFSLPLLIRMRAAFLVLLSLAAFFALAISSYGLTFESAGSQPVYSPLIRGPLWDPWYFGFLRTMCSFTLGVATAKFGETGKRVASLRALWCLASLALMLAMPFHGVLHTTYDLACILAGFPLLIRIGSSCEPPRFARPLALFLGEISFAVYAIHFTLCGLAWYYLEQRSGLSPAQALPVYLASVLVLATLTSRILDPKLRGLLRHLLRDRHPARIGPALGGLSKRETVAPASTGG